MKVSKKVIILICIAVLAIAVTIYVKSNWVDITNGGMSWLWGQVGGSGDAYQIPSAGGATTSAPTPTP